MHALNRFTVIAYLVINLMGVASAAEPNSQDLAIIKEIQAQQAAIAENQAKIDAKLVTVGEAVRVARIYSSRGGH